MSSRSERKDLIRHHKTSNPSLIYSKSYNTLRRGLLSRKKKNNHFRPKLPHRNGNRKFGRDRKGGFIQKSHFFDPQYRYHQRKRYVSNSESNAKYTKVIQSRNSRLKKNKKRKLHHQHQNRKDRNTNNNAVHHHIRYFQAPHDLIPQRLVPYLADIADHSKAFYYQDESGKKCLIYAHCGECGESGEPRFVFVSSFDIDSQTLRTLDRFPCSSFFKASPLTALDRKQHVLYLMGNHVDDNGKLLSFSLQTNSMVAFKDKMTVSHPLTMTMNTLPVLQLIDTHYEGANVQNESDSTCSNSIRTLNRVMSSEYILRDSTPVIQYKRYLFVPKLGKLLRFGGEDGVNDLVQFIDLQEMESMNGNERNQRNGNCSSFDWISSQWQTYKFRLPGSALTMHFVLGYDHLLYVFDVKGGGEGKIWIIDLLFEDHRIDRALKELDSCFNFDFGVKISTNYVQFINASSYGELLVSMSEIMPPSMSKHYDLKTKMLVEGYCRRIASRDCFSYVFPLVLVAKIFTFYPPFF